MGLNRTSLGESQGNKKEQKCTWHLQSLLHPEIKQNYSGRKK